MSSILYLLNHKTLTDFEVPILISQGHSVLLPKVYKSLSPTNSVNWISTHYYDNFLFIDTKDLNELNDVDWFSNSTLSDHIMSLVNKYFSYIFITLLTNEPLLSQLVKSFRGIIYYRLFGREGTLKYEPLVKKYHNVKYILSYDEILDHEKYFFHHNNTLVIPLGLSNTLISKIENTYTGKNNRIVFICSRISKTCPYYQKIYQEFMSSFEDLSYILLGRNNEVKSLDLSDDEYYREIANSKVMYYHGKEPRHLHYHPLEAMFIGIPVIFHKESLLSKYLYESPGMCNSIDEAKMKVKSILLGDERMVKKILDIQNKNKHVLTQSYLSKIIWAL